MNRISDDRLLARLESLTQRECDTTLSILLHLNELEGRRLHLSMGYASMFDFVTRHLRYSASAAGRRIQVARCLRRFPALVDPFRLREINLGTVSLIARVIDQENARELLRRIRGIRDAATPIRVRVPTPSASSRRADSPELFDSRSRESRPGGTRSVGAASGNGATAGRFVATEAQTPTFKIQFAAGPELMTKLEEARTLLSGRSPKGVSFEEVFDAALDALLDRKSPARRQKRREARRSRKRGPATSSAVRSRIPAAVNASTPAAGVVVRNPARSRHVPLPFAIRSSCVTAAAARTWVRRGINAGRHTTSKSTTLIRSEGAGRRPSTISDCSALGTISSRPSEPTDWPSWDASGAA
jgi:hypothetical protein